MKTYTILGLMSGTSLDGLDMACCQFELHEGKWRYHVLRATTVSYPSDLATRLAQSMTLSGLELMRLDADFAVFMAKQVLAFADSFSHPGIELIASHGHTVFHKPGLGFTTQIGNGAILAAKTGIPTACDFRSVDVALGGQGAPLVPIGDELLFGKYDICLNLGGFSNLSYSDGKKRIAFDVSPCNMALNTLARQLGKDFDCNGELAQSGHPDSSLLAALESLEFYRQQPPKSLGKEWFNAQFLPILKSSAANITDQLATVTVHIAKRLAETLNTLPGKTALVTGGGAKNRFLINSIKKLTNKQIIIPEEGIIDFKEAIIFAFLGLLRLRTESNSLQSVTGARCDSIGGAIYHGGVGR